MKEVVVGLDLHLNKTQGVVMSMDGKIIRQERFDTNKEGMKTFLENVPRGTKVVLESAGFCWPWIDLVEELGYKPLLANPVKVKSRAEDVKTDKVDAELLANLARMNWLPESYVPSREFRWLRSLLRHRAFRRRTSTAVKNRTWSEFRKRDLKPDIRFDTRKGRREAACLGLYEIGQNMEILELLDSQMKEIEKKLEKQYADAKPVRLMRSIPGVGPITALTLYSEVCDIRRFSTPEKLAHYAGLVPRVRQSGEVTRTGRGVRANRWLKWILIEAAWMHVKKCPKGRLAQVFRDAYRRKRDKNRAIKVVARKLVNVIWAIWTYEREFMVDWDKGRGSTSLNGCG